MSEELVLPLELEDGLLLDEVDGLLELDEDDGLLLDDVEELGLLEL